MTADDKKNFEKYLAGLSKREKVLIGTKNQFYIVDLKNPGGLVMPVILQLNYTDGSSSELRLPAELWVENCMDVSKLIISAKEITSVELDPHLETADVERSNNYFPPQIQSSRFKLFQEQKQKNEMQKAGLGEKAIEESEKSSEKKASGE